MEFGTEFTTLSAVAGSKKENESKNNNFLMTRKQWALVIALGISIALALNFCLFITVPKCIVITK
jgi:hypothetical protein